MMRAGAFALAILLLVPAVAAADGETVARDFLNALKAGDLGRAKKLLDPRYGLLPREGLDALFRYEAAHQPNLAFLVGQSFDAGTPIVTGTSRSEWYVLDGTRGHSYTVPLRFEAARTRPFVLPSPVAFGRPMAFVDFMNFVKHPEREGYDALTLRLRRSVAPGLIAPPAVRMIEVPGPPVPGDPSRRATTMVPEPGLEGGLLGWRRPRDPGRIVLPSGEPLTAPQLEALLPRLSAIAIHLTVMQRGRFASWKIERVGISNAVFTSHGEEISVR